MISRYGKVFAMSLLCVLGVGIVWVSAGNIDPPVGPIQPTMHSLDEIYDLLSSSSCSPCVWESEYHRFESAESVQLVAGAGIVHGVLMSRDGLSAEIKVSDGQATDPLAFMQVDADATSTLFIPMDVRYENGLWAESNMANAVLIVYYRSDS